MTPTAGAPLPVTLLSGFLGAGKTTLIKKLIKESFAGQKVVLIENEFGEENIDNELLISSTTENIIQMNNGCICCTIRDDLRVTLQDLAERRRKGEIQFDR